MKPVDSSGISKACVCGFFFFFQELQSKSKVCANVFCGAGRECAVTEKGEPTCLCIEVSTRCIEVIVNLIEFGMFFFIIFFNLFVFKSKFYNFPYSHFILLYLTFSLSVQACKPHKRSVCGSNGKTYRNHCELHRDACLTGLKIQVVHDGHCQGTGTKTQHTETPQHKINLLTELP